MSSKVEMNMHKQQKEKGFVAIFTVIFFILLISVLTLGFLRIMITEQEQAVNDDLTKGGLAAAEAGVEDAKRALLAREQATGALRTEYDNALSTTACPGIFGNATVRNDLGLVSDPAGGIRVSSQSELRQRHTCVTMEPLTDDYVGNSRIGVGELIPLRGTANYSTVEISWHYTPEDGTPTLPITGGDQLYRQQTWLGNGYPAIMRLQFLEHGAGAIFINLVDTDSRTVFLAPASSSVVNPNTPALDTIDPRAAGGSSLSPLNVQCNVGQPYVCTARIPVGLTTPATVRFLRVTSVYDTANFRIRLFNPGGGLVQFDGVQPVVDSTGVANDVFRRVQARIQLGSRGLYTDYALETGENLCKDFFVSSFTYIATDAVNCP